MGGDRKNGMNEKFFDLKKEKQDRIMSAAMEMFAKSGYTHASTDDMVKRAHISKGLLFHYFGSKLGLYTFLYDYCVRFMQLEFSRVIPDDETDFFRLQDLMCAAWFDAVRQYPYIRLFILSGERETDRDALNEIREKRETYRGLWNGLSARYGDLTVNGGIPAGNVEAMLWYTLDGMMEDMNKEEDNWTEVFVNNARTVLEMVRRMAVLKKEDIKNE